MPTLFFQRASLNSYCATLIDNIFGSNCHLLSGLIYSDISDYLPIFSFFESKVKQIIGLINDCNYNHIRLEQAGIASLKHDLFYSKWPELNQINNNSMNFAYDKFIKLIRSKIHFNLPFVSKKSTKPKFTQLWMTYDILKSGHNKNKLYKQFLKGQIQKSDYCDYKNTLTKIIKSRKLQYHQNFIHEYKLNASAVWKHINSFIRLKSSKPKSLIRYKC